MKGCNSLCNRLLSWTPITRLRPSTCTPGPSPATQLLAHRGEILCPSHPRQHQPSLTPLPLLYLLVLMPRAFLMFVPFLLLTSVCILPALHTRRSTSDGPWRSSWRQEKPCYPSARSAPRRSAGRGKRREGWWRGSGICRRWAVLTPHLVKRQSFHFAWFVSRVFT